MGSTVKQRILGCAARIDEIGATSNDRTAGLFHVIVVQEAAWLSGKYLRDDTNVIIDYDAKCIPYRTVGKIPYCIPTRPDSCKYGTFGV